MNEPNPHRRELTVEPALGVLVKVRVLGPDAHAGLYELELTRRVVGERDDQFEQSVMRLILTAEHLKQLGNFIANNE